MPPPENEATLRFESNAPTDRIDGQFAGWLTGSMKPGRLLPLTAAATISVPAANARRATVSKMVEKLAPGCTRAPSDIDTTAHLFVMAQLIPARMPESEPLPSLLSTLPAKISASGATP